MKKIKLGGIIEHKDLSLISIENIPDRPGIAGLIFQTLSHRGINVEFIIHCLNRKGQSQVILCVSKLKGEAALAVLMEIRSRIGDPEMFINSDIALLSIFGPHFRERPGIAGTFFGALNFQGINIMAISTSISTCSCVIPAADLPIAVKAVGEAFEVPGGEE
ncbi:MAG: ACT domain-containing protein [Deltaproteobacteria bacterium]|nr:ACT domain-containing protein [Deltaproteobacteria bacterium]